MSAISPDNEPVRLTARRVACENRLWTVYFDDIADGDGQAVSNYIVLAPKARGAREIGGVCVLPLLPDGQVILLKTYRHPLRCHFWECARGFVDPDEAPETAALRELHEETGLACTPSDLIPLGVISPEASTIIARIALFAALNCRPDGAPVADELGLGAAHRFEAAEVQRMAQDGRIEDSTTLVTLYRFAALPCPASSSRARPGSSSGSKASGGGIESRP